MAIFYFMAPDRVAKACMTPRGRHSTPKSLWSLLLSQAIDWPPPYPRRSLLRWISPGVGRGLLPTHVGWLEAPECLSQGRKEESPDLFSRKTSWLPIQSGTSGTKLEESCCTGCKVLLDLCDGWVCQCGTHWQGGLIVRDLNICGFWYLLGLRECGFWNQCSIDTQGRLCVLHWRAETDSKEAHLEAVG